jgi:hypothetical protein
MIEELEKAIKALAMRCAEANAPLEAMQFAQAACNAANALATVTHTQKQ